MSNHRQVCDELMECSVLIQCAAPSLDHHFDHLVESINHTDSTLQAAICLIRDNSCEKNLKLRLHPLLNLILIVDQVTALVPALICRLSTSKLDVDPQELTFDGILETNSKISLKIKNMS